MSMGTSSAVDWRDCWDSAQARESVGARDRRIFGGGDAAEQAENDMDLRGPMLEVVLGLFDGLDYEEV